MKTIFFYLIALMVLVSCQSEKVKNEAYAIDPYNKEIIADEIIQGSSYTYILAGEEDLQYWVAVSKADVKKGNTYYYSEVMEMNDFHSKELNRTFESIFFVGNLSEKPIPAGGQSMQMPKHEGHSHTESPKVTQGEVIQPVDGSISLAELYQKRKELDGKSVKIAGEVVKYNPGIMGKNWVHIQDGTGVDEFFDLTITTQDMVSPGDIVLFEGTIVLNKDLGSGYFFEILMEDAKGSRLSIH
jgi:hypothetical protein